MSDMDILMYLMEERKQMIEKLLEMCNELLELNRELKFKYLKLWYDTKYGDNSK